MRIGIFGTGRLGTAVAQAAGRADDVEVAWALGRDGEPTPDVDVAIDASLAAAVPGHVEWAQTHGVALAIGATGWELPDLAARVADGPGVLVATNFSLSVALLARFASILGAYSDLDETRDPYLIEHHHRLKADAPSGTAVTLAEAVLDGSARKRAWTLTAPAPDELHVAVLRAGSEFGRHTVGIDSPAETLEITHHARSRAPFADGAIVAARWIAGRRGLHTMADLAADILDPLFENGTSR